MLHHPHDRTTRRVVDSMPDLIVKVHAPASSCVELRCGRGMLNGRLSELKSVIRGEFDAVECAGDGR